MRAHDGGERLIVSTLRDLAERLYRALSPHRRGIALILYTGTAAASYATAYFLRFEFSWPEGLTRDFLATAPLLLLIRILSVWAFGLTLRRWRYVDVWDVLRLTVATFVGSAAFLLVVQLLPADLVVPRSVIAIDWVLTTYATAGSWITYRLAFDVLRKKKGNGGGKGKNSRVLVVGAGEAGSLIAREMLRSGVAYEPVGFLDDDPSKWGVRVHGIEVIGAVEDAPSIAEYVKADELVIAIPSAEPPELRRIVDACEETGLPTKVLPGINEVIRTGKVELGQLRDVEIEDLLGREPVELELPELAEELSEKTVLVTGAAGSIGSELSRQVALHNPEKLILFDQSESDLYFLDLELRDNHPDVHYDCVVGDLLDRQGLERLFREHRPDRIFHAAAYKHVPLMECNVREAIRNNVIGTHTLVEVAGDFGVEEVVLISTDKAVNPSSVMGATKRASELILRALKPRYPETWMVAVRFGNVLGSRGSVIPLFKKQLANGKPLTVTHPEIERYFMTIPEAVQLVLQASLLSDPRGLILMLEMGEPVKIVEMAKRLIRLSGLEVGEEADIEFVGLRPGEKLTEELTGVSERSVPTRVDKIRVLVNDEGEFDPECFLEGVNAIGSRMHAADNEELQELLIELLPHEETRILRSGSDRPPSARPSLAVSD